MLRGRACEGLRRLIETPGILLTIAGLRAGDRAARLRPRAGPLSRRPLVRREGRGLLDRLRPRDRRLDRQARHALEVRLAAARRLCPVRRRHEPGEPARRPNGWRCPPTSARRPSRPSRCGSARSSSLAGPVANFLLAILILAGFAIDRMASTARRRWSARSSADSAAAAAGPAAPATGSSRSAVARSTRFDDLAALRRQLRPGEPVRVDYRSAAAQPMQRRRRRSAGSQIRDRFGNEYRDRPARRRARAGPVLEPVGAARGAGRRASARTGDIVRDDGRRRSARSSPAAARSRNSAGRSASPRSRASSLALGLDCVRVPDRAHLD